MKLPNGTRVKVVGYANPNDLEKYVGKTGTVDDLIPDAMYTEVRMDEPVDGDTMLLFNANELEVI